MKYWFSLLILLPTPSFSETINTRVVAVLDGDTILIRQQNAVRKVRLAGIDAPEKQQAYGLEAKQQLSSLVLNRNVTIETSAVDDYGRLIGEIKLDKKNINHEMIRLGYAWEYSYRHQNKQLKQLQLQQQQAQQRTLGLWQDKKPTEPWLWRKNNTTSNIQSNDVCQKNATVPK